MEDGPATRDELTSNDFSWFLARAGTMERLPSVGSSFWQDQAMHNQADAAMANPAGSRLEQQLERALASGQESGVQQNTIWSADSEAALLEELQGGVQEGPTSTEALLAELRMLQESMNTTKPAPRNVGSEVFDASFGFEDLLGFDAPVLNPAPPNRPVPSPLDLINREFVTDFPGKTPFESLGASVQYSRSTSLQQSSQNPICPPFQVTKSASFPSANHLRSSPSQVQNIPPTRSLPENVPSVNTPQNQDTSRIVSAAEIMKALNRLPSRSTSREGFRAGNSGFRAANPASKLRSRSSSLSSTLSLQDPSTPELFVQMSDEVLESPKMQSVRKEFRRELEELKAWCGENLPCEVVLERLPGVYYLACNALPAMQYKVARFMMAKVTLWLQQMRRLSNVRSYSPVDLYMTIHEAGKIFLDCNMGLLANIPSQEARDEFMHIYFVMEKMKKEATDGLRFSMSDPKADTDVKPKVLRHSESGSGSDNGSGQLSAEGVNRNKRKTPPSGVKEGVESLKKRLGLTNQLGNKGSEQQRQWLKGLHQELAKLNEDEEVVMFDANPGGLAPVRRFVSEAGLMAKYHLRMSCWRILAAASEKFDTLAKGTLPSFEKYVGFAKYTLGTCVGLTMAFCAIAGRETEAGNWDPKAEAVQALLERTKKGVELAAELACILTDLRTYEEDLLKLRVNAVGVMMREGGRSQQEAVVLLEKRAETIFTALIAEVTSPPSNNPVLWTCWKLIFDFGRAQIAMNLVDDFHLKVKVFFEL